MSKTSTDWLYADVPDYLFECAVSHTEFKLWCFYSGMGTCGLSLADVSEKVGMSTGAVSIANRLLLAKGMIQRKDGGLSVTPTKDWKSIAEQQAIQDDKHNMVTGTVCGVSVAGWVYVLGIVDDDLYKIGMTTRTPDKRLAEFAPKMPYDTAVVATKQTQDVYGLEAKLHSKYADMRVNGEWFRLNQDELNNLTSYLDNLGE